MEMGHSYIDIPKSSFNEVREGIIQRLIKPIQTEAGE